MALGDTNKGDGIWEKNESLQGVSVAIDFRTKIIFDTPYGGGTRYGDSKWSLHHLTNQYEMKKYLFCILFLSVLLSCSTKTLNNNIVLIEVVSDAQYFEIKEQKIKYIGSVTKIAFKENLKMYILLRKNYQTKDVYDDKKNTMTSTVVKVDTSFLYYVIKNGSKIGLVYGKSSENKFTGKIFQLDTLLKYQAMDSENYKGLSLDIGNPIETIKINNNKKIEKYLYNKTKKSDPDSIYRYYDRNFKQLDFTFSNSLDKKEMSKLIRIQLVYNPMYDLINNNNTYIPRREINWLIRKGDYSNEILLKYFKKFMKDIKNI